MAGPGTAGTYRELLAGYRSRQGGSPAPGPSAVLFGQAVRASVSVANLNVDGAGGAPGRHHRMGSRSRGPHLDRARKPGDRALGGAIGRRGPVGPPLQGPGARQFRCRRAVHERSGVGQAARWPANCNVPPFSHPELAPGRCVWLARRPGRLEHRGFPRVGQSGAKRNARSHPSGDANPHPVGDAGFQLHRHPIGDTAAHPHGHPAGDAGFQPYSHPIGDTAAHSHGHPAGHSGFQAYSHPIGDAVGVADAHPHGHAAGDARPYAHAGGDAWRSAGPTVVERRL